MKKKAFTLMECLVGLFFLALIALYLLPGIGILLNRQQREREEQKLYYYVHNSMERIKSNRWRDRPVLEGVAPEGELELRMEERETELIFTFYRNREVTDYVFTIPKGL